MSYINFDVQVKTATVNMMELPVGRTLWENWIKMSTAANGLSFSGVNTPNDFYAYYLREQNYGSPYPDTMVNILNTVNLGTNLLTLFDIPGDLGKEITLDNHTTLKFNTCSEHPNGYYLISLSLINGTQQILISNIRFNNILPPPDNIIHSSSLFWCSAYNTGSKSLLTPPIINGPYYLLGMRTEEDISYTPHRTRTDYCIVTNELLYTIMAGKDIYDFPYEIDDNPYGNTENGETGGGGGGGGGNYDTGGGAHVGNDGSLPTYSAANSNFIKMYCPTQSQLSSLSEFLWSDDFIGNLKKLYQDPINCLVALGLSAFSPPMGGAANIIVGTLDSEVSAPSISNQYGIFNFGSINVRELWGNFLDYSPYTKAQLHLPYIGTVTLDADDIMNSILSLEYYLDFLTGDCVAKISVTKEAINGILYEYKGNFLTLIPYTSANYSNYNSGIIKSAGGVLAGAASVAVGGVMGNPLMMIGGTLAATSSTAALAGSALYGKPNIERGGNLTSSAGMLGIDKAFLILQRPKQALPSTKASEIGYPVFISVALSSCSGYTKISEIHLDGISATENELIELERILKEGVFF